LRFAGGVDAIEYEGMQVKIKQQHVKLPIV
jgi:hypothetical protein